MRSAVPGEGFGVSDLGFAVWGLGFGVWGLWFGVCVCSIIVIQGFMLLVLRMLMLVCMKLLMLMLLLVACVFGSNALLLDCRGPAHALRSANQQICRQYHKPQTSNPKT